jgi:hypothetical protein
MLTSNLSDSNGKERTSLKKEPRWPAAVALLAVGSLRLALPPSFSAGPNWLLLAVVTVLIPPTIWALYCRFDGLNRALGYILISIVTADMIWSLYHLVAAIPSHKESPVEMLRSAAALWITNILVFASWYCVLTPADPVNVNDAAFIPMARFSFRR